MNSDRQSVIRRTLKAAAMVALFACLLPVLTGAVSPERAGWSDPLLPGVTFHDSVLDPRALLANYSATSDGVYRVSHDPEAPGGARFEHLGLSGVDVTHIALGPPTGACGPAVYASTSGGIYRSLDCGVTWALFSGGMPTGSYQPSAFANVGNYMFVNVWGSEGAIYRTDGTMNWTPVSPLPEGPHGPPFVGTIGAGQDLLGSTLLLVGTSGSGLFKSHDLGGTWLPTGLTVDQASYVVPIAEDPLAPGTWYAANGDAQWQGGTWLYQTHDAGANWNLPFAPGDMSNPIVCIEPWYTPPGRGAGNRAYSPVYLGTSGGKVWQSLDGGASWTDISAGLPSRGTITGLGRAGDLLLAGLQGGGVCSRLMSFCTVTCAPAATPSSGIAPLTVTFDAGIQAAGCDGGPFAEWSFGDGTTSVLLAPTHTYAAPGTYSWTMTATVDGRTCSGSGTVTVTPSSGTLYGSVVVGSAATAYLLNGPGVLSATAKLADASGNPVDEALVEQGAFRFEDLQPGMYQVSVDLLYLDHIPYDAQVGSMGCPHPSGEGLQKQVLSSPVQTQVAPGYNQVEVRFPPPLVFVHGVPGCYQKWYSADPAGPDYAAMWDVATREQGVISFTPNYEWSGTCLSWNQMAKQLHDQIFEDLLGLHTQARGPYLPPAALAAYDFGGLVARALCSGPYRDYPGTSALAGIFLMATPNSGADSLYGGGANLLTSPNFMVRRFNEVYPDFGGKTSSVFAVGGNNGWWNTGGSDGRVSLYSAFNIARLSCNAITNHLSLCRPYTSVSFPSGGGHIFPFTHAQVGSPDSTQAILLGTILPILKGEASVGSPESPAGGTMWGTGARTTGNAQGSVQSRAPEGPLDFPFTCSATDGMGVVAFVTSGSAEFEVVAPSGRSAAGDREQTFAGQESGFAFSELNPAPGEWSLRVTPGPQGATFQAVMLENSLFGISAYTDRASYLQGESAILRVDEDTSLAPEAEFSEVKASVFTPAGALLAEVPLLDDGEHHDGDAGDGQWGATVTGPEAPPGSYPVAFEARGTYMGETFVRTAYERIHVVASSHFLTGVFADTPVDLDGDGKFDAVRFTAQLNLPAGCGAVVTGDIADADGEFIGHASAFVEAPARGLVDARLWFRLERLFCSQLLRPLQVINLEVLDGLTLAPVDRWGEPVPTANYDSATFDCRAGTVTPSLNAVRPDQATQGQVLDLVVSGRGFLPGATLDFGSGIILRRMIYLGPTAIVASVTVLPDAAPGPRAVTVTNPGNASDTAPDAFEVVAPSAPSVVLQTPAAGETLAGTVKASAGASDAVRVSEVALLVDGVAVATDAGFPFQFAWDTTSVSNGPHAISARATNSAGLSTTSPPVQVSVNNATIPGDCDGDGTVSIGEVQKAINMFLGIQAVGCGVDCNGDGTVSIGEVQKVINVFLGLANSC